MTCPGCGAPNHDDALACRECGLPAPRPSVLAQGFRLAGRYTIVKVLGRGGMGTVYEAKDQLLEETVAIKVLRPETAAAAGVAQRFRAEIKLARAVSHKNVCRIHEYGEDRGIHYISMAYVDGVDLKQVLRERGPLPPAEAFDAVIPVAQALQAIHDEGIVHRDLKTANIMIDARGVPRLMDFGIAKDQGEDLSLTDAGKIMGTPEYMSPEQVQAQHLDGRSDIYSLGIVVFEVFTGTTPFRADSALGTAVKHLKEPPPLEGPPASLVPPALVPVLRKALAKMPAARYASASEMAAALEAARAAGEDDAPTLETLSTKPRVSAPPPTRTQEPTPPAQPFARGLAIGIASLLVAGGAIAWLSLRPTRRAEPASEPAPTHAETATPAPLATPTPALATPEPTAPATALPRPATRAPTPSPEPAPSAARTPAAAPSAEVAALDARVERLLAEAEDALVAQGFDTAIERYEAALQLDPRNAVARTGRAAAVSAKAARGGSATPPPPRGGFVAGRTSAESPEARSDAELAGAFEASPEVAVTHESQAGAMPGRIEFRTEPASVGPGDAYRLEVRFMNTGRAAIQIREMFVTTTVNGRRASGPVAPSASTVAPGQGASLLRLDDTLREDLATWSLEVQLLTSRGERYRNRLDWSATGGGSR